jgi:hypothetical protein
MIADFVPVASLGHSKQIRHRSLIWMLVLALGAGRKPRESLTLCPRHRSGRLHPPNSIEPQANQNRRTIY